MEQHRIWRYFQNEAVHSFSRAAGRYEVLVKVVLRSTRIERGRCLNIGIGGGGVERGLLKAGWMVSSLDLDDRSVASMRQLGVDARQGYVQCMSFPDDSFDAVVISEVLEHIQDSDRQRAICEIWRVLRPNGILVGTVPFREDLRDNEVICPYCGAIFHRWGHVASFNKDALLRELSPYFVIMKCYPRAFISWKREVRSVKQFLKAIAKLILARIGEPIVCPSLFSWRGKGSW